MEFKRMRHGCFSRGVLFFATLAIFYSGRAFGSAPDYEKPPFQKDIYWGPGRVWPEAVSWGQGFPASDQQVLLPSIPGPGDDLGSSYQDKIKYPVQLYGAVYWHTSCNEYSGTEWAQWMRSHSELMSIDANGNPWMHENCVMSYAMPLEEPDWPIGIENATYGQWLADRLVRHCLSAPKDGIFAADFVEGVPHTSLKNFDYHPRVLAEFEKWAGLEVPGSSVKDRAAYIQQNCYPEWIDFWCHTYAKFYALIVNSLAEWRGWSVVGSQSHFWASQRRQLGTDHRIMLQYMRPEQILQTIELQSDVMRNVGSFGRSGVIFGGFACREPRFNLIGHMDADHGEFWTAVDNSVPVGDKRGWGEKYLKHHWLDVGLCHVANPDGSVHRGIMGFMRHYWDGGSIDSKVVDVIHSVVPAAPFGPAFYYSVSIERSYEQEAGSWDIVDPIIALRGKWPFGYWVSDIAVDGLLENPQNRPSGWVCIDKDGIPDEELEKIRKIAPLITEGSDEGLPFTFEGDLAGYGLKDKQDRVVILVFRRFIDENPPQARIKFKNCKDGTYNVEELYGGDQSTLTISGGSGTMEFGLAKWDSKVFAIGGEFEFENPYPVTRMVKQPVGKERPSGVRIGYHGSGIFIDASGHRQAAVALYCPDGSRMRFEWRRDGGVQKIDGASRPSGFYIVNVTGQGARERKILTVY
jgi:hypothetical protein